MRGKIIFYNTNEGTGKIITKDSQKYNFDVDAWEDYDVLPKAGLEVVFSEKGLNAISIKVGQLEDSGTHSKSTQVPSEQKETKEYQGLRRDSEHKKVAEDSSVLKEIKAHKGLHESMDEYFGDYYGIIQSNQDALASTKTLDYFRMRRFLNTAFHNLKQVDRSISNDKFKEIEAELKFLKRIYDSFVKITSLPPEVAYEMIFLDNQPQYQEAAIQLKTYKQQMETATRIQKALHSELQHKERQLKNPELDKEHKEQLEKQIKPVRRDYADAVFDASKAKESIVQITKSIDAFKKEFYDAFLRTFEQNITYLKDRLIKILDARAYEFDYILWANAKESPYIRKFFTDCKIEGSYCSRTFLKYYMKSLDKDKLTDDNKKLFDLLRYLESEHTKKIVVIAKDLDFAEHIKVLVERIDKDLNVIASTSPVDMINACKKYPADVIILEFELRLMDAFEFIKTYTSQVKALTEFCLVYDERSAKSVESISENPLIKHYFKRNSQEREILKKLKTVI
ncbi:MAG: hypothetical protein ACOCP1_01445 [Campylobacterales bacterium]